MAHGDLCERMQVSVQCMSGMDVPYQGSFCLHQNWKSALWLNFSLCAMVQHYALHGQEQLLLAKRWLSFHLTESSLNISLYSSHRVSMHLMESNTVSHDAQLDRGSICAHAALQLTV